MPAPHPACPAGWHVHDIVPHLQMRVVRDMPGLSPALEAEIDRLWAAAQRRMDGRLFNGRVFSADAIAPDHLTGHWTEFRRIVAQMDQPGLFEALRLRPLAVNGILLGPDGVVLGQRPADAVYQPGQWQAPPAGSVDIRSARPDGSVDVLAALFAELREEVGLPADAVHDPRLLGIVEHAGSHVLDLGIALRTRLRAAEIRAAHAAAGDGEYRSLAVIPPADLPGFLAQAGSALAVQTPLFLARMGLLRRGTGTG
ncbi:Nudix hydrolase domain-containing protein [Rhodovastum atsumiense]|uniref:Nudix hydrolase domain-containing protein n=1 Tax=Rhodovastum atsumiense TaxID=504468 RepID=A0A5M6IVN9_9PROT|nr:NUDIX domain-containing protein [Rhodovastum atsumiense]KAA5612376.1 hypothetical protein F1189_09365 [Rhodovastum atsumiense]CAH2600276.1 Nudix hydrolase domain-containing protein [Rhodovastum atsumiense]